jgi:hypothetical protein
MLAEICTTDGRTNSIASSRVMVFGFTLLVVDCPAFEAKLIKASKPANAARILNIKISPLSKFTPQFRTIEKGFLAGCGAPLPVRYKTLIDARVPSHAFVYFPGELEYLLVVPSGNSKKPKYSRVSQTGRPGDGWLLSNALS